MKMKKKRYCGAVTKFSNSVISDFLMNFRQIQKFEIKQNYKEQHKKYEEMFISLDKNMCLKKGYFFCAK